MRKLDFVNQEYYHIYNRGVDKRDVFFEDSDYIRFLKYLKDILKNEKDFKFFESLELICYCLNPNHFHLMLKQLREGGISEFMHFLATAYTMYFNIKYKRSGSLFQGAFKAIHVDSDEYLVALSIYINGNAQIHNLINNSEEYPWSSYREYLGLVPDEICQKEIILRQVKISDYKKMMERDILFSKEKKLQRYIIE